MIGVSIGVFIDAVLIDEKPMAAQELWQWVHYSYGEELGLTSSDDDYVKPSSEETQRLMPKLALNDDKVRKLGLLHGFIYHTLTSIHQSLGSYQAPILNI